MTTEIRKGLIDSRAVLPVFGEIDIVNADALHEQLLSMYDDGRPFVIADMSDVTFIDSSGLSALAKAQSQLQTHGCQLRLVIRRRNILRLLEISGLDEAFAIYPSVEDASSQMGA